MAGSTSRRRSRRRLVGGLAATKGSLPPGASHPPSAVAGLRQGIRDGAFLSLATAASSALRAAFLVLAARLMGPEPYGELYAALSLVLLLGTGVAPLGSAVAHFTSLHAARGELGRVADLRRQMGRRAGLYAAVLAAAGILAARPLQLLLGFDLLSTPLLVAAALATTLLLGVPRGVLRGIQDFRAFGLNLMAEALLRLGLAVPLLLWSATAGAGLAAYAGAGLAAYALARLQSAGIGAGEASLLGDPRPVERMMGPLLAFAFLGAAYQSLDMLFVNKLYPASEAGLYAAASAAAKLTLVAFLPFSVANLPVFTAALARGERLGRPLLRSIALFLLPAAAALGLYGLWGEGLLGLLYGRDFAPAARWLLPLTAALGLGFVAAMIGQAFCAGRSYRFLLPYGAGLVVEVVVLGRWRGSLDAIPWFLLGLQALVLAALGLQFILRPPEGRHA